MTDGFFNILKWFCTLTERLFIWIVSRWDWQCIWGGSSVLKSTRSTVCLHLKISDMGQRKAMRNASPNTAQKTAEGSRQTTCRKTERIHSWKENEGFQSYCTPAPCSKAPLQPFGKVSADFWMLFFMRFFENIWDLLLSQSKESWTRLQRLHMPSRKSSNRLCGACGLFLGTVGTAGYSLAAALMFKEYFCTYRSPFWLHSMSEGILMSELCFSPFE